MIKSAMFFIGKFDQEDEEVWKVVNEFTKEWNEKNECSFIGIGGVGWNLNMPNTKSEEYTTLLSGLNAIKNKYGVIFHHSKNTEYDDKDYQNADFIFFVGISLYELKENFVQNEEEIIPIVEDCSACGKREVFGPNKYPYIIDENLLKSPLPDYQKPNSEDWDLINVAGGHFLISLKFKNILEENQIKGYRLKPVISKQTKRESTRVFQFLANKSIVVSALPQGVVQQPFCTTCGSALTSYNFDFSIKKEWIGEDDFFARGSYKGSNLHLSNRVYQLIKKNKISGFVFNKIVCF